MKKIINKKEDYVREVILGLVNSDKKLKCDIDKMFVYKSNISTDKVNLISGGGAGHEPAHAGFVGDGLLSAAVFGHVFTSPTPDQIKSAIDTINSKEILLVVKNYTGDVMNFKIAAELANAEGKKVEYVVVDDDIAVENSTWTEGKRGVAGTILVHKIAGAAAHQGKSLLEVKKIAEKVIAKLKTIGVAIEAPTNPSDGVSSFELKEDEMEFGIGIHGEPGIEKSKIKSSKNLVKDMMDKILKSHDFKNKDVALIINGMGSTPISELYIINNDVFKYAKEQKINVYDNLVGNYMTSLDMKGFSITLLELDDELKKYLNSPADSPALHK